MIYFSDQKGKRVNCYANESHCELKKITVNIISLLLFEIMYILLLGIYVLKNIPVSIINFDKSFLNKTKTHCIRYDLSSILVS